MSKSDLSVKNLYCRAGHQYRVPRALPFNAERTARQVDTDGRLQQSAQMACYHRRAGASTASQGFASAALVNAKINRVRPKHLHKTGINPACKTWMGFNLWSEGGYRCGGDIIYQGYRMGVAHGYGANLNGLLIDLKRIHNRLGFGTKGNVGRIEYGHAHIDGNLIVVGDM